MGGFPGRCNGQKERPNSNRHRCIGGSAEKGGMSHSGKKTKTKSEAVEAAAAGAANGDGGGTYNSCFYLFIYFIDRCF